MVAVVPHSRRFITRRFWCVLARHRLYRLSYESGCTHAKASLTYEGT